MIIFIPIQLISLYVAQKQNSKIIKLVKITGNYFIIRCGVFNINEFIHQFSSKIDQKFSPQKEENTHHFVDYFDMPNWHKLLCESLCE